MSVADDLLKILREEKRESEDRLTEATWQVVQEEREIIWIEDAIQDLEKIIKEEF